MSKRAPVPERCQNLVDQAKALAAGDPMDANRRDHRLFGVRATPTQRTGA